MIHTVIGFGIVNKARVDVFLELPCVFGDPTDVGNLISGSSAFSKSSLNIWKFTIHVLLKPGMENFEHYFASMWDKCKCAVVWTFLKRWEYQTTLPASWEICMKVKRQQLELDMEQRLVPNRERSMSRLLLSPCSFDLYAEYIMWNAGLDEAQLKSRFLGEISITSDMQMTPPLCQKN